MKEIDGQSYLFCGYVNIREVLRDRLGIGGFLLLILFVVDRFFLVHRETLFSPPVCEPHLPIFMNLLSCRSAKTGQLPPALHAEQKNMSKKKMKNRLAGPGQKKAGRWNQRGNIPKAQIGLTKTKTRQRVFFLIG